MADRKDYYYKQKVTEAELDLGFEGLEDADRAIITDLGLTGVALGTVVQRGAGANISVDVNPHEGYDDSGQRLYVPNTVNLALATDYLAVSTDVSTTARSKILSVFLVFQRNLSDPRLDGNSMSVFFDRAEGYALVVKQGAEALSPTPPPLEAGKILICDVTRTFGQTQILNSNISFARRQDMFRLTGAGPVTLTGKTAKEIAQLLQDALNTHISNGSGAHAATALSYAGGPAWRDATTNPATTVEAQLDKIVTDLGDSAVNGTARISSLSVSGVNVLLSAGSARSQIVSLLGQLDTLWASLVAVAPGAAGSSFVGADAVSTLPAGTVRSQLQTLDKRACADALTSWSALVFGALAGGNSFGSFLTALPPEGTTGSFPLRQSGVAAVGIASGGTGHSLVGTSIDGSNFPALSDTGLGPFGCLGFNVSPPAHVLYAGLASGPSCYYSNDDGVTWGAFTVTAMTTAAKSILTTPGGKTLVSCTGSGSAVGGIFRAAAGVTGSWTNPQGSNAGDVYDQLVTSGSVIACRKAQASSGHNFVLYSTDDGVTWVSGHDFGITSVSLTWSSARGVFVVMTATGEVWTSPTCVTWTKAFTSTDVAGGIVPGPNQLATCGFAIAHIVNRPVNSAAHQLAGVAYSLDLGANWNEAYFGDYTGINPMKSLLGVNGRLYASDHSFLYRSGVVDIPGVLYTGV